MASLHYQFALLSTVTGKAITESGGKCYVAQAGLAAKQTLYNKDGSALANPITPTNGQYEFYTADTAASVDLYIQTPSGRALQVKSVTPSAPNEFMVDTSNKVQLLVIPFSIADTTAATETDTGFDIPTDAIVQAHLGGGVDVLAVDATETIEVGILSSESGGDADGFYDVLAVDTAGAVKPEVTITSSVWASTTFGVMLADFVAGTNSDDRGLFNLRQYRCNGTAKSVSYTLTAGTDTATGFIKIPYVLSSL